MHDIIVTIEPPDDFEVTIEDLTIQAEAVLETINITENDTYEPPYGVDGYNKINVNVQPNLQDKSVSLGLGEHTITADEGFDGMSVVHADVRADLEDITITENGTYTHEGKDGYDEVKVDVPADLEDITITENGTYASQTHDGYREVEVNVQNSAVDWVKALFESTINGEVTIPPEFTSFIGYVYSANPFIGRNDITVLTVPNTITKWVGYDGTSTSTLIRFNAHFKGILPNDMLIRHKNLTTVVIYEDTEFTVVNVYFVENCINFDTLIIRRTDFISATYSNMFAKSTKMNDGTGRIYVLPDLVDDYKNATNWLVYANQIYPLYIASTLAEKAEFLADETIIDGAMIMCDADDSLTVKGA